MYDSIDVDFEVIPPVAGQDTSKLNTRLSYALLDAIGCCTVADVVVHGIASPEDIKTIGDLLDNGQFNADQVGLLSLALSVDDENFIEGEDHNMHNLDRISFTEEPAEVEFDIATLVAKFKEAAQVGWIEFSYPEKIA